MPGALGSFARSMQDLSFLCGGGGDTASPPIPHKNDRSCIDLAKLRSAALDMIMGHFGGVPMFFGKKEFTSYVTCVLARHLVCN